MKTLLRICALLFLFVCASPRGVSAPPSTDDVWVNIRFLGSGPNSPAAEYFGTIHKADLAAMLGSTGKIAGMIKVAHVAFMQGEGQILPLSETGGASSRFGFKNVMYIRADTILRITELDDTFVTERLLPLKE